jgi:hypothetical protein
VREKPTAGPHGTVLPAEGLKAGGSRPMLGLAMAFAGIAPEG